MNYKLDLTKPIIAMGFGYTEDGKKFEQETEFPLAEVILTSLAQVSTFADAEKAESVLVKAEKAKQAYAKKEAHVEEFTEDEFAVVFKVFKLRPTSEKIVFMHMAESNNDKFSLVEYELNLAKAKAKA